ncbi:MAG: protein kinase [Myxococcales bacterium]|nr:protein kinase [Myxococcales bacterium]
MAHPTLDDLLAGDPRSIAHVTTCPTCRRLSTLAGLEVPPTADAPPLPDVDRTIYDEWAPLADARGGMGSIFAARDRRLDRVVAIKQIRGGSQGARAALRARFEREARLTARLQHPAIVGVHEAGRFDDGEPFYAMPLLAGAPLGREIARRATLAARLELVPHVVTVAEAVAFAHARGIVHRDIKPDNILIGDFGETVLIDWGLAKEVGGPDDDAPPLDDAPADDGLTRLGAGTAQYMPPEQGRGATPDARVDVYAVGATLYHVLAGAPPYGDRTSTAARQLLADGPPPPLGELAPEVPAELSDIVDRAMARDREVRYATAQELADELRRFLTGQLLRSRRYGPGELLRHFARRYRTALQIVAVALVVLVIGGALSLARIARERDRARAAQRRAEIELRRARGVLAHQLAAAPATRYDALLTAIGALGPDVAAGRAPTAEAFQGTLDVLSAGPMLRPLPHVGLVKGTAVAGDALLGLDEARQLLIWDARSGELRAAVPLSLAEPETLAVAPDGRTVAVYGFTPGVEVVDLATRTVRTIATRGNPVACWLVTGDRLVVVAEDLTVRDLATLDVLERQPLPAPAAAAAHDPRGQVAIATVDGGLVRWAPGGPLVQVAAVGAAAVVMGFGVDGTLFHNGADHVVRAWGPDAAPGTPGRVVLPARPMLFGLTPIDTRHGLLAIGLFDEDRQRATVVLDPSSGEIRCELPSLAEGWLDDGWLLTERWGPLDVVDVSTCRPVLTLELHHDEVGARPTVDPANARLVTASRDGSAFVVDLRSGRAAGMLLGHSGELVALAPSPTGAYLLSAGHDGHAVIWRAADGVRLRTETSARELLAATWLDDDTAVIADAGGEVRAFSAATGATRGAWAMGGPVSALAVSARGALAIGTLDGGLTIVAPGGGAARSLPATGAVTALAWTHDGRRLASGHAGGVTVLWDIDRGAATARREAEPGDEQHDGHAALAFAADDAALLAGRPDGTSLVLDGRDLASPAAPLPGRVWPLAAADGALITTAVDGVIAVRGAGGARVALAGRRVAALAVARSPSGDRLAVTGADGVAEVWTIRGAAVLAHVGASDLGAATAVAFVDEDRVVVGYAGGALRAYPVTPAAALTQACGLAAVFGGGAAVAAQCGGSSATAIAPT